MKGMVRILFTAMREGSKVVRSLAAPLQMVKGNTELSINAVRVKNFLTMYLAREEGNIAQYTNVSFEVHYGEWKTLPFTANDLWEINEGAMHTEMPLLEPQVKEEVKPARRDKDAQDEKLSPAQKKRIAQASEQRAWREFQGKGRPGKRREEE